MRDGKFSWPKTLVKKWLNIRGKTEDYHADDVTYQGDDEWSNFPENEARTIKKSKTDKPRSRASKCSGRSKKIDLLNSETNFVQNYRIFVSTWNVGGKSPPNHLNLEEWLHTSPPADIYILGFQEIVPLNACNVLGTEDNGPARRWLALIRKTLNTLPSPGPNPIAELNDDFERSNRRNPQSFFHRRSSFLSSSRSMRMMENDVFAPHASLNHRYSVCERAMYDRHSKWDGSSDDETGQGDSPDPPVSYNNYASMGDGDRNFGQSRYCLVASKQMVGIFLTVWAKSDLRDAVRNLKVSCVGRGLMGYLGNKGSISISMSLHQTSFCFVCSHLTSGERDGDEVKRNSDVVEILRKTRFPRMGDESSPETILEHDRVIWLGDLNYRIALSYRCAKALVEMRNWRALFENDQLRIEQRCGRIFAGWNEGRIYFPPTYKYSNNSDRYAGDNMHPKEKRRTPAWCDRILWHGRGLVQQLYVRGESRFSDHRPVYSLFLAQVESTIRSPIKKSMAHLSSRVEVEELLPFAHRYARPNYYYS